jgi:sugar phosphate isomerase/epimerase
MPPSLSLAYLTSAPFDPPDAIALASRLGYEAVGLRIRPAAAGGACSPLETDKALLRETQARLRDTGLRVLDVEIVRLGADFHVDDVRPFLDVCSAVGARAILVAGDDPDEARLTAAFSAFCEAAAPHGVTADLEFMPWTQVPEAATATRIVVNAAQPNGRVLVDALHAGRSRTTLADLAAIPRERLGYAQICDAPLPVPTRHADLIHTARNERLLPGEGGIDLMGIFNQLPRELPISVEIPHLQRIAALGQEEWSRQALAATRAFIARRDEAVS